MTLSPPPCGWGHHSMQHPQSLQQIKQSKLPKIPIISLNKTQLSLFKLTCPL